MMLKNIYANFQCQGTIEAPLSKASTCKDSETYVVHRLYALFLLKPILLQLPPLVELCNKKS